MKKINPFLVLLAAILVIGIVGFLKPGLFSQGVRKDDVAFKAGVGIAGANVAICQPLATTAASVTANIATFTMASNPQTAGFVAGMQLQIAGFTGGDTFFNAGTIANNTLTGGYTILSVNSTQIIVTLVHANASAATNGTAFQLGNPSTSCAGLATLYTDSTLGTISPTNPVVTDGLGNYGFWSAPGQYIIQVYGATVTTKLYFVSLACVPNATGACVSSFTGTVSNGQIVYATGASTLASSPNFLWTNGSNLFTVQNPSAGVGFLLENLTSSTNVLAQSSPIFTFRGQSWNGANTVDNDCTIQNIPANGTNAGQILTINCSLANTQLSLPNTVTLGLNVNSLLATSPSGINMNSAAATGIANQNSPPLVANSAYWNGAASVLVSTTLADLVGTGTTPTTTTTMTNTGAFNWAGLSIIGPGSFAKALSSIGTPAVFTGTGACATFSGSVGGAWAGSGECTGGTAASTLTITFTVTQPHGYACYVQDETTPANLFQQTSHSPTTCVFTIASVTHNDVFVFSAIGF